MTVRGLEEQFYCLINRLLLNDQFLLGKVKVVVVSNTGHRVTVIGRNMVILIGVQGIEGRFLIMSF